MIIPIHQKYLVAISLEYKGKKHSAVAAVLRWQQLTKHHSTDKHMMSGRSLILEFIVRLSSHPRHLEDCNSTIRNSIILQ